MGQIADITLHLITCSKIGRNPRDSIRVEFDYTFILKFEENRRKIKDRTALTLIYSTVNT
jgi:hypothetical protein